VRARAHRRRRRRHRPGHVGGDLAVVLGRQLDLERRRDPRFALGCGGRCLAWHGPMSLLGVVLARAQRAPCSSRGQQSPGSDSSVKLILSPSASTSCM
jgi:hypothetical protein